MLDPLPEQLPEGTPYHVPDDIRDDPGDLFAYICAICYGNDVRLVWEYFQVTRQTFWIWRKHGKGVPENYRKKLDRLIAETRPPHHRFRLPENATVEHLMRPPRGQHTTAAREPSQNYHLIELLHRICSQPKFGHATLKTIISQMSRPVSNPYVFYRWAWAFGGVPRSYVAAFVTALMQLRIYELYDYTDHTRVQWEGWAERTLAAPEGADETEDQDKD